MPGSSHNSTKLTLTVSLSKQTGTDTRVEALMCHTQSLSLNNFTPVWDKNLKSSIFQFLSPITHSTLSSFYCPVAPCVAYGFHLYQGYMYILSPFFFCPVMGSMSPYIQYSFYLAYSPVSDDLLLFLVKVESKILKHTRGFRNEPPIMDSEYKITVAPWPCTMESRKSLEITLVMGSAVESRYFCSRHCIQRQTVCIQLERWNYKFHKRICRRLSLCSKSRQELFKQHPKGQTKGKTVMTLITSKFKTSAVSWSAVWTQVIDKCQRSGNISTV